MTLFGIDVSSNNGVVNWDGVKSAGETFGIAKATEGNAYVDPQYARNWAEMGRVGLVRGSYCFSRPDLGVNPVDEARFFLNHLGALNPGDLVMLDLELPTDTSMSAAQLSWHGLTWLQTVESALGFKPLLYTYPWYAEHNLTEGALGAYPLWLASYDGSVPPRIGVWDSVAIWQYGWTGRILGVTGSVDVDQLARTLDGLRALGKPAPAPPPPIASGDAHWQVVTPMHFRLAPSTSAAWGPLLPAGTKVVEVDPPQGPRHQNGFAYCRTSGDLRSWLLLSNLTSYTP